ncbi:hypothetical protein [Desulfotalea psychrophila]|uniref:Uncharacterized protein n=1 Tax=Desulfotalea psychrophila (strain LSv54 / DSM 12343) TaxID=177439 RepID=Q6ALC8_DESPS|nr:hypothetical protein [Desulfotalea psychrophila]CAG36847.1 unknown protein [Desulfotalea psychrophila LSv54]
MTKKISIALIGIELLMLLALVVLEYFSSYRAGIMHHLYYKKRYYLTSLYQQGWLSSHLLAILAFTLVVTLCTHGRRLELLRYGTVLLLLLFSYFLMRELNVYAHLLMVLEGCLLLETLRVLFFLPREK